MGDNTEFNIYDDVGFDAEGLEDLDNTYDEPAVFKYEKEEKPDIQETTKPTTSTLDQPLSTHASYNDKKEMNVSNDRKHSYPSNTSQNDYNRDQNRSYNSNQSHSQHHNESPQNHTFVRGSVSAALHLGNLHWWITEDDIRKIVSAIVDERSLVNLTFQELRVNGKSRGLAYLQFKDPETCKIVKEKLENYPIDGRNCTTNYTAVTTHPFKASNNTNGRQKDNNGQNQNNIRNRTNVSNNNNQNQSNSGYQQRNRVHNNNNLNQGSSYGQLNGISQNAGGSYIGNSTSNNWNQQGTSGTRDVSNNSYGDVNLGNNNHRYNSSVQSNHSYNGSNDRYNSHNNLNPNRNQGYNHGQHRDEYNNKRSLANDNSRSSRRRYD
ncbi:hypothetical protein K502DRAFT_350754 [Neoconidiobolus thromboides FSU 785]|nr:hypothetical protein K502DRAFT_350754 [Neoconidiobolus thromboides FSU 785]